MLVYKNRKYLFKIPDIISIFFRRPVLNPPESTVAECENLFFELTFLRNSPSVIRNSFFQLFPEYKKYYKTLFLKERGTIRINLKKTILAANPQYCYTRSPYCIKEVINFSANLFKQLLFLKKPELLGFFKKNKDFCDSHCPFYYVCWKFPIVSSEEFIENRSSPDYILNAEFFEVFLKETSTFKISLNALEKIIRLKYPLLIPRVSIIKEIVSNSGLLSASSIQRKNLYDAFAALRSSLTAATDSITLVQYNLQSLFSLILKNLRSENIIAWHIDENRQNALNFFDKFKKRNIFKSIAFFPAQMRLAENQFPNSRYTVSRRKASYFSCKEITSFTNVPNGYNVVDRLNTFFSYNAVNILLKYKNPYFLAQANSLLRQKISVILSGNIPSEQGAIYNKSCAALNKFSFFEFKGNIYRLLKKYFSYDTLLPGQFEIIHSILNSFNVFSVLPTGGGKTLTFILPALYWAEEFGYYTVIISPLIALMRDQVKNLFDFGIATATFINSTLSDDQRKRRFDAILQGENKIIYLSVEQFKRADIRSLLRKLPLQTLVLDEAHCLSIWGADFRPEYMSALKYFREFNFKQLVAVTASATNEVAGKIEELLYKETNTVFLKYFHPPQRDDLKITVFQTAQNEKFDKIKEILTEHTDETTIIYCTFVHSAEELYAKLSQEFKHIILYHGKLSSQARRKAYDLFLKKENPVVICTNAFGMGINRNDVRNVVHYEIPVSIENFYQEIGRASRDRTGGNSFVLKCEEDTRKIADWIKRKRKEKIEMLRNIQIIRAYFKDRKFLTAYNLNLLIHDKAKVRYYISLLRALNAITFYEHNEQNILEYSVHSMPNITLSRKEWTIVNILKKESKISVYHLCNKSDLNISELQNLLYALEKKKIISPCVSYTLVLMPKYRENTENVELVMRDIMSHITKDKIIYYNNRFPVQEVLCALTAIKKEGLIRFYSLGKNRFSIIALSKSENFNKFVAKIMSKIENVTALFINKRELTIYDDEFEKISGEEKHTLFSFGLIFNIFIVNRHAGNIEEKYEVTDNLRKNNIDLSAFNSAAMGAKRFAALLALFQDNNIMKKIADYFSEEHFFYSKKDVSIQFYTVRPNPKPQPITTIVSSFINKSDKNIISLDSLLLTLVKEKHKNNLYYAPIQKHLLEQVIEKMGAPIKLSDAEHILITGSDKLFIQTYTELKKKKNIIDRNDLYILAEKYITNSFIQEEIAPLAPAEIHIDSNNVYIKNFGEKLQKLSVS